MNGFCENQIRPVALLDEYLRLSADDARRMVKRPGVLSERACPGCGGQKSRPAFDKNGFILVHCEVCETLYASPGPTPDALADFYRDSESANYWASTFFPAVAEARREAIFAPRAVRVAELIDTFLGVDPDQNLVDVGAGSGLFLEEFKAVSPETSVAAIEPGVRHAADLRNNSVRLFEGYADAAANDPEWAGMAACVTCFEVIEHIPDTVEFLLSLRKLARPGGIVILSGLSGDGFDIITLGANSKAVSPPHHLTFLSLDGVRLALKRADLDLLDLFTPGELDVDIVRNAALEDPTRVADPALRDILLNGTDEARTAIQAELKENRKSSHMWIVARRPMADVGVT